MDLEAAMPDPVSPSLAQAQDDLRDDHLRLERLAERLRSASDLPELVSAIEELAQALSAHFAHEERPGGLYDALGLCAPEHRDRVRALVDEHLRLLAGARSLAMRGRALLERSRELQHEATDFAATLRGHEVREHALAREAMGAAQPPH